MRRLNTIRLAYHSTVTDFWLLLGKLSVSIAKSHRQKHDKILLSELRFNLDR
jgi:hypothetical protein